MKDSSLSHLTYTAPGVQTSYKVIKQKGRERIE